jgi:uncharacterized protein (TIGR02145 family)
MFKFIYVLLLIVGALCSCKREGCTNSEAINYDEKAKKDNESCEFLAPQYPVHSSVIDESGNTYRTVKYGEYEWMIDNLLTTKFCNGDTIPSVDTNGIVWYNYLNLASNDSKYGKLYSGNAVNDERNICPCEWHVPTVAEWDSLIDFLGGEEVAGGKMKTTGTTNWSIPNVSASNQSNFSGLPGGFRFSDGVFQSENIMGAWWSSTEVALNSLQYYLLHYNNEKIGGVKMSISSCLSVRCVKD